MKESEVIKLTPKGRKEEGKQRNEESKLENRYQCGRQRTLPIRHTITLRQNVSEWNK